jgi:hypothetical protein
VRAHADVTIDLPWLAPFDAIMAEVGYGGHILQVTAPAGSDVVLDVDNRRARILFPDGRINAWADLAEIEVDPSEPSWQVKWRVPGTLDRIELSFIPNDDEEDEEEPDLNLDMQVYSEEFEGQEARFPEFVKLLTDPVMNPHGFALGDGVFRQEGTSVRFDVTFGRDGGTPFFQAQPATLPAELNYPFITDIGVTRPVTITYRDQEFSVSPGFYRTTVGSFNIHTGDTLGIQCKALGGSTSFRADGEQLIKLIHEGAVEIQKIVRDRKPSY